MCLRTLCRHSAYIKLCCKRNSYSNNIFGNLPKFKVTRYIKKVEKSDDYLDSVLSFSTLAEEKVKQNVALEIYEDYFHETDPATDTEKYEVKTIISYPDPSKKSGIPKRPVTSY